MSLGHTDRQRAEALPLVSLDLHLGLRQQLDIVSPVDLLSDRPDLVLDAHVELVEELEVAGGVGRPLGGLCQVPCPHPALGPVATENGVESSRLLRQSSDQLQLLLSVGHEDVDGHHDRDPEHVDILDLLPEIAESRLDERHVGLSVLRLEGNSRRDCWT